VIAKTITIGILVALSIAATFSFVVQTSTQQIFPDTLDTTTEQQNDTTTSQGNVTAAEQQDDTTTSQGNVTAAEPECPVGVAVCNTWCCAACTRCVTEGLNCDACRTSCQ
jgi:hypothetical protein